MGMFVRLRLEGERCAAGCAKCASVCPVDIFHAEGGRVVVVAENEDECTLCGLCLEACPNLAVRIIKLYEEA